MPDIKLKLGPADQAIAITLDSLANTALRGSAFIDNSSNLYFAALITLTLATGASAPVGDKLARVYLYGTTGGATYPGGATGTDAAVTLDDPPNLKEVEVVAMPTASGTFIATFDTMAAFPAGLPARWGIVVKNSTGFAFAATGNSAKYQGIYAQSG